MFTEELKLIKEAEERADNMRKDAKVSAKRLAEETDAKANQMVEDAFAAEREKCHALIEDGRKIADGEYSKAMRDARERCDEIEKKASGNIDAAVKFIAERIVKSSVNC